MCTVRAAAAVSYEFDYSLCSAFCQPCNSMCMLQWGLVRCMHDEHAHTIAGVVYAGVVSRTHCRWQIG